MSLGNGQQGLREHERASYARASSRADLAGLLQPQESLQLGTPMQGLSGLRVRDVFIGHEHLFVEQAAPPSGVMDGFIKTCQRWGLSEREQLVLLGYSENEMQGRQLLTGGWLIPSQDVKDRAGYVLGISLGLGSIFDELMEAEVAWLKKPHRKLQGATPLAFMLGGRMSFLMTVAKLVTEERELG